MWGRHGMWGRACDKCFAIWLPFHDWSCSGRAPMRNVCAHFMLQPIGCWLHEDVLSRDSFSGVFRHCTVHFWSTFWTLLNDLGVFRKIHTERLPIHYASPTATRYPTPRANRSIPHPRPPIGHPTVYHLSTAGYSSYGGCYSYPYHSYPYHEPTIAGVLNEQQL